jgi:anaerobic selenocysteine-containing dehydrogenase
MSPSEIEKEKGFQSFTKYPELRIGSTKGSSMKGNRFILVVGELVDYLPSAGFWPLPKRPEIPLFLQIHPKRARELGIENGGIMIVENELGRIKAPAWVTDQVDEETILCPLGADPYDPIYPFETPYGLIDFMPENENCGRRYLGAALVKVRRSS